MQELSNIGRASALDQSVRAVAPRERPPDDADGARKTAAAPPSDANDAAQPAAAPQFGAGGTHARLSYDVEDADVYVEILNPRTGDVIRRLPPEDAAPLISEISGSRPGAIVDGIA